MKATYHWECKTYQIRRFIQAGSQKHTWFIGDTISWIIYEDQLGRIWHYAWGILKPTIPTYISHYNGKDHIHVDALGGQSWQKRDDIFVCCFRTSLEEIKSFSSYRNPTMDFS